MFEPHSGEEYTRDEGERPKPRMSVHGIYTCHTRLTSSVNTEELSLFSMLNIYKSPKTKYKMCFILGIRCTRYFIRDIKELYVRIREKATVH